MNNKNSIGFIGLGVMGFPMASNLLQAGKELVVFDINTDQATKLPFQERVTIASSKEELAKQVNIVLLMLPNSPHVQDAILSKGGLAESLSPGALICPAFSCPQSRDSPPY